MAKKKAATKKKLIPHKEVKVKSLAYGEHTRAARGSKTPVGLNEAFALHNAKTVAVSSTAKRVHDLLKRCGTHFKEAMLWQTMLSRMRKAASDDVITLLATLKGMDLNSRYPMSRFAYPTVISVAWDQKKCVVALRGGQPHVKNGDTQYCYEVYLLIFGKDAEEDGVVSGTSEWMKEGEDTDVMRFEFAVPSAVTYYVICVHLMTGHNGRETGTLASRAMKILDAGKR